MTRATTGSSQPDAGFRRFKSQLAHVRQQFICLRLSLPGDRWLEEFHDVSRRVFAEDLLAAWPLDNVVSEADTIESEFETKDSKSSTVKTNLDQPPGLGVAPSGMGRDADAFGPATQSVKSPCTKIAIAGPNCCWSSKPSFDT